MTAEKSEQTMCGVCETAPAEFHFMCRIVDGHEIHGDVCEEHRQELDAYADQVVPL